jgi:alcohol dehydrogenase class IV
MRFEFATATRILFGSGTVQEVAPAAAAMGRRLLLVAGRDPARSAGLRADLAAAGLACTTVSVAGEPTVDLVRALVGQAGEAGCDLVVGVGGGSVLDAGKAVAALLANPGDPLDYLEVVGRGRPLANPSAPFIAIPTTAGTGTEVTRNAVLASPAHGVKASLRSPGMFPRLAVVDPDLTRALPAGVTASTGLDALTQLVEPFVSGAATPLTDAVCREGMGRVARSLRRACSHGEDSAAREDMALASLFGGLALANARLGAVHGFAAVLGGRYPAPHGAVCARLLPFVMARNVAALSERAGGSPALARYEEIACLLTGHAGASIADGIRWLRRLGDELEIPPLRRHGLAEAEIPGVVAETRRAGSTKGNPIALTDAELADILREAL